MAVLLLHERRAALFWGGDVRTASLPLRWHENIEGVPRVLREPVQGLLSSLKVPSGAHLKVYVFPEAFQVFSDVSKFHNPSRQDIEALARKRFASLFPDVAPEELQVAYSFGVEGAYVAAVRRALLDALANVSPHTKAFYSGTLSLAESLVRSLPPGVPRGFVFYIDGGTALGTYIVRTDVHKIVRLRPLEAFTPGERLPEAQIREYALSLEQELEFLVSSPERIQFYAVGDWSEEALRELGFSAKVDLLSEENVWLKFTPEPNLLYGTYSGRKSVRREGVLKYLIGALVALIVLGGGSRYVYLSNQVEALQREVEELERTKREGLVLQKRIEELEKESASLRQAVDALKAYPYPDELLSQFILALRDLPQGAKVERVSLGLEGGGATLFYGESLPPPPSVIVEVFERRGFKGIRVQAIERPGEGPKRVVVVLPSVLPSLPPSSALPPADQGEEEGVGRERSSP